MSARKCVCRRHVFHALSHVLGPYGRQDVHVHPCHTEGCDRVLLGEGRTCKGKGGRHWRATLTERGIVRESRALEYPPQPDYGYAADVPDD